MGSPNHQSSTTARADHFRVSANALKTVEHRGGLDAFLLKASSDELSIKARKLKSSIAKKLEEKAA